MLDSNSSSSMSRKLDIIAVLHQWRPADGRNIFSGWQHLAPIQDIISIIYLFSLCQYNRKDSSSVLEFGLKENNYCSMKTTSPPFPSDGPASPGSFTVRSPFLPTFLLALCAVCCCLD
ncbi:Uncharacterized protein Fot_00927 [Forsythia ovata]|uniref:Uncharacterized protein n=1 Tax=Forsythia ovata TaxID=205694 RepID=A0ABD1X5P1_9LAMI